MDEVTFTEDFPRSKIEFYQRFSKLRACYEYMEPVATVVTDTWSSYPPIVKD